MNNYLKTKRSILHSKLLYILSLVILSLYSCYKNGYLAYNKGLKPLTYVIKPLGVLGIGITIGFIIDAIWYRVFDKDNYKIKIKNSYNPIYTVILNLLLPIDINILWIIIVDIFYNLINRLENKVVINTVSLVKLLTIFGLVFITNVTYLSLYEINVPTLRTTTDLFFGYATGGIGTTNAFLLLITYFILMLIPSYKREIPVYIIFSYLVIMVFMSLFGSDFREGFKLMLNSQLIYAGIFVATIPNCSPILRKERVIYGVLVGILSYGFIKLNQYEGVLIAILIGSIIIGVLQMIKKIKKS